MLKRMAVMLLVMGAVLSASAGTIAYDSIGESGFQWIHAPNSTVSLNTYAQTDSSITFYNGVTPIATGTWNGEGWMQGSFTYGTDSSIYAQVVIGSGPYAGWYHNLNIQAVTFPVGNELIVYNSGGTNPNGSGWVQVPEPGTWAMFGLGMLTLVGARLRRRR